MKFKKALVFTILGSMVIGTVGCGGGNNGDNTGDTQPAGGKDKVKVTLLGAGYGDKSYWDSAKKGAEELKNVYADQVEVNIVDMSPDTKKWISAMHEAGESDADVIITGGFQQKENVEEIAGQYPDKQWIMFDSELDYESYELENAYSMGYMANQSGYLAGMTAAYLTTSDNDGINEDNVIGFVGGMDNNPVVNDFLVGYIEGAKAVDPDIKMAVSYVNSFEDSAKAKEIAMAQFNSSNVDVIFSVAGASGTGCIESAFNEGKYVIGVDSDQSLLYEGREEQKCIVTSALKRVDKSIVYAIGKHLDGSLPYGKYELLGLKEEAVGIVYNDIMNSYVDESFTKELQQAEKDMADGKITVSTAFDMTNDEVKALVETVK